MHPFCFSGQFLAKEMWIFPFGRLILHEVLWQTHCPWHGGMSRNLIIFCYLEVLSDVSKREILVSLSALLVPGKNKIKVTDALQGQRTRKAREEERVGRNENDNIERLIPISQPFLSKSMSLYFFITHRWTIPMKDYLWLLRIQEKRNTTE